MKITSQALKPTPTAEIIEFMRANIHTTVDESENAWVENDWIIFWAPVSRDTDTIAMADAVATATVLRLLSSLLLPLLSSSPAAFAHWHLY